MKLTMPSLFLKIFLWFWATVIATGIALVLTFIFEPRGVPSQWHATLMETAHSSGAIAVSEAERGGDSAAAAYIGRIEGEMHLRTCLFDQSGALVAGSDCGSFQSMTSHVTAAKPSNFSMRYGIARVAIRLKGSNGHDYIFATELPAGPRAALGMNPTSIALQWGVALLVSGLICYLLTRYLTAPILRLRAASQQLAAGDLSTRAAAGLEPERRAARGPGAARALEGQLRLTVTVVSDAKAPVPVFDAGESPYYLRQYESILCSIFSLRRRGDARLEHA